MPRYENLYIISPADFFSELEKEIEELRRQQSEMQERMTTMLDLADEVLVQKVRGPSLVKRWYYDVRFPNYVLDNLYAIEQVNDGFKRWVGPGNTLEWLLTLDRSVQYQFEVHVVDFFHKAVEENFKLNVDIEEIPWLSITEGVYRAIIPEENRPRLRSQTQITLGSNIALPAEMPENDRRTLWFSISSISLHVLD